MTSNTPHTLSAGRPDDDRLRDFLRTARNIAVVGLSGNRFRASHGVARYLQTAGYRIFPVNPNETEVLGEKAYPRLEDIPEKIDIVDVFRRPEHIAELVESAIRIGAKMVWMQDEVRDEQAAALAARAGLMVVMDDCLMREHHRLLG